MQVSYNWLKELVNVDVTSHDLSEKMSTSGIEVEGVETRSEGLSKLVVGEVLSTQEIPETHLNICQVNVGEDEPTLKRGSKLSLLCRVLGFQVITKSKKGKSVALKVLV